MPYTTVAPTGRDEDLRTDSVLSSWGCDSPPSPKTRRGNCGVEARCFAFASFDAEAEGKVSHSRASHRSAQCPAVKILALALLAANTCAFAKRPVLRLLVLQLFQNAHLGHTLGEGELTAYQKHFLAGCARDLVKKFAFSRTGGDAGWLQITRLTLSYTHTSMTRWPAERPLCDHEQSLLYHVCLGLAIKIYGGPYRAHAVVQRLRAVRRGESKSELRLNGRVVRVAANTFDELEGLVAEILDFNFNPETADDVVQNLLAALEPAHMRQRSASTVPLLLGSAKIESPTL